MKKASKNRKKSVTFGFLMFHRPPPVYPVEQTLDCLLGCNLLISAPVGESLATSGEEET